MNRPSIFTWRPATTYFLIGGLVLILVSVIVSFILSNFQPTTLVRVGSGAYRLWIADNEVEREQGLSGVKDLKANGGLLMKFDADNTWGIWMKDMKIPIDIVWLDKNKVVVYIVKQASQDLGTSVTFAPKTDARYVLELPAGSAAKAGIKTGQTADFDENDKGGLW